MTWFDSSMAGAWVMGVLAKGTLLLVIAWFVTLLLRRSSAASRHLVWTAALGAMLVMPMLVTVVPTLPVVPIARTSSWLGTRTNEPEAPPPGHEPVSSDTRARMEPGANATPPADHQPTHKSASSITPAVASAPLSPAGMAFLVWLLGGAVVMLGAIGGHVALHRMVRGARPIDDADWRALAEDCAERLSLARPFTLLRGPAGGMPLTFGFVEAKLLLPADADAWPFERRRAVMLHELAHVQRGDVVSQGLGQLACAVFWFHPLAWHAAHRMRVERERACDDRVIAVSMLASDYAEHLLEVAKARRTPAFQAFAAVSFARPSHLEGRILAVLDPELPRTGASRAAVARVVVLAVPCMLVLATLAPTVAPAGGLHESRDASRMAPAVVMRPPAAVTSLDELLTWIRQEVAGRHERDVWIGYSLAPNRHSKGGTMGGDEGFDLDWLSEDWPGPTLAQMMTGRDASRGTRRDPDDPGPLAILLRGSFAGSRFVPVHMRFQNMAFPTDLANRPVYWLGEVDDAASIGWIRELIDAPGTTALRDELVESVGVHADAGLVVPYLRQVYTDAGDVSMRKAAVEALGRHPTPEVEALLIKAARSDDDDQVRAAATESLGHLGTPGALDALLALAGKGSSDPRVSRNAVEAIGQELASRAPDQRTRSEAAFREDIELAKRQARLARRAGTESDVQRQAVEAIGRFPEAQGLPRLIELTRHSDLEVARQAVETIGRYGSVEAYAALAKIAWNADDPELQRQAIESIGRTRSSRRALTELNRIARTHPVSESRRQAAESVGRLDEIDALAALIALTRESNDPEVVRQAVEGIGRLDDPGVMPALAKIAGEHKMSEARREAVECMGRRDPAEAAPYLERIVRRSGER